jgi:histone chaperone ASF1
MNVVNVTSINVLDNPCAFSNPFQFEITFECMQELKHDLDWKVVYVGSAESEKYDQELESVLVGPVPVGVNKFVFQAPPPDAARIPHDSVAGVTVVLVTCSYEDNEFIRVGYYVNNFYADAELEAAHPNPHSIDLMRREILAQKPRVTRFPINWDNPAGAAVAAAAAAGGAAGAANASSPGSDGMMAGAAAAAAGGAAASSSGAGAAAMDKDDDILAMDEDDEEMDEEMDEGDDDAEVDLDALEANDAQDLDDSL